MKKQFHITRSISHFILPLCFLFLFTNGFSQLPVFTLTGYTEVDNHNKPPDEAVFESPQGLFDADSVLYITEIWNSKIYRYDKNTNLLERIAGTGVSGYSPDGTLAKDAQLGRPEDVVVDSKGNIYFSDSKYSIIRMIKFETGELKTVAGMKGLPGHAKDGEIATKALTDGPLGMAIKNDTIYYCEFPKHYIRMLMPAPEKPDTFIIGTFAGNGGETYSGDGGPATEAALKKPQDLAFNSDKSVLYIGGNNVVRKIDMKTKIISHVAGDEFYWDYISGIGGDAGSSIIGWTQGITLDNEDNIWFAMRKTNAIGRIDAETNVFEVFGQLKDYSDGKEGILGFYGDGGPASQIKLSSPWGIEADDEGNIFIADIYNKRVRKIDADLNVSTFAGGYTGNGQSADKAYLLPQSIVIADNGDIYFSDLYSHSVRKYDVGSKNVENVAGVGGAGYSGDGGPAAQAELNNPYGLAIRENMLYVADVNNHRIREIDLTTGIIATVAGNGGNGLTTAGEGGQATSASLRYPKDVEFDAQGNMYITQGSAESGEDFIVWRVDQNDAITRVAGVIGEGGDEGDGAAATEAKFKEITQVVVEPESNTLYITDMGNNKVRSMDLTSGMMRASVFNIGRGDGDFDGDGGFADAAALNAPRGLAIDEDGNVLVADANNHVIRKVDYSMDGVIDTYAGIGDSAGFAGDGTSDLSNVLFNTVYDVKIAPDQSIYIVDHENRRIRILGELPSEITNISAPDQLISIYPNPVEENIKVFFQQEFINYIQIIDLKGRIHLNKVYENNGNGPVNINVSHLPGGVYFVKVNNHTQKFFKQ